MTQTNALPTIFTNKHHPLRVMFDGNDEPWWVAADVCKILDHSNVSMATNSLDEDEKGVRIVYTPGGPQPLLCVSESGVYSLIFKSRKAEAKAIRRWVTHEVLPAIRKTGMYALGQQAPTLSKKKLYDRLVAHEQLIPAGCFTPSSVAAKHLPALMDMLSGLDGAAMSEHSIAQRFARYAKEDLHIPEEHRRRYPHVLANGRVVQAWAYDRQYLPIFVQWLWGVYFPQHFPDYERYRARYIGLPAPNSRRRLPSPMNRSQAVQAPLEWE